MTHVLPINHALLHIASSKRLFDHLYESIYFIALFSVFLETPTKEGLSNLSLIVKPF